MKPVAVDLCCGLGGWTAGLLSEGWDVIGFDIERHEYGDKRYPAQLILKSILELNGYDLRAVNPSLVVASPPCQEFSYYLWGDVGNVGGRVVRADLPAKFGEYVGTSTRRIKCRVDCAARRFDERIATTPEEAHAMHFRLPDAAQKTVGHVNKRDGFDHTRHLTNQRESDGVKHGGDCFNDPDWPGKQGGVKPAGLSGPAWFDQGAAHASSKSDSRKAASAMIAEIPFDLARYVARAFKPS